MKILFKLILFAALVMLGGVVLIKVLGRHTWRESFEIADQFIADLLS